MADFDDTHESDRTLEGNQNKAHNGGVGGAQIEAPDYAAMAAMDPPTFEKPDERKRCLDTVVTYDDFYAYLPKKLYIYIPTGDLWPAASVDAVLPWYPIRDQDGNVLTYQKGEKKGQPKCTPPTKWIDTNKAVQQMTWAPGEPIIIGGRSISNGGWVERQHHNVFNFYQPPVIKLGDAAQAGKWLKHVKKVYPADHEHIINFCAHRRQKPKEKINHALLVGGKPGIGKDTIFEPLKMAVGHWNFSEVSPEDLFGNFKGYLKCVVLRINEGRDLGEVNRYQFYNRLKIYTAAPPDVIRVNEKNIPEHYVLNCLAMIITTNEKDGFYLPADDRRHYVAWSDLAEGDFCANYWNDMYHWFEDGGYHHVAAYLDTVDLSGFDAKAPPKKTDAFWEIVGVNRAPEVSELGDALDQLQNKLKLKEWPVVVVLSQVLEAVQKQDFKEWLQERKNRRWIPNRFNEVGYVQVRNQDAKDGLWRVYDQRQVIYAKSDLTMDKRLLAAKELVDHAPEIPM